MEAKGYAMQLGDAAPDFELVGVDGARHALADYAGSPVLAVVFTCNHCPYAQAYEERLVAFQRDLGPRGVQLVAINANETTNYPTDDLPHMMERAKERGFNFPYLRDDDQSVAEAYGAVCTPHVLLFDDERRLRYQGRIDDEHRDPDAVKQRYLRDAAEALLDGKTPDPATTWAIGCSIKWDTA